MHWRRRKWGCIAACPQGRACSTRGQRCLQELPTSETQRPCPGPGFKGVRGVKVRISLWFTSQPPPRRPALPQAAWPAPASYQAAGRIRAPPAANSSRHAVHTQAPLPDSGGWGLPVQHRGGPLLGRPGAVSEPRDRLLVAGGEQDGAGLGTQGTL